MMTIHLSGEGKTAGKLELPVPPDELNERLDRLRLMTREDEPVRILSVDAPIPSLSGHLRDMKLEDNAVLKKLNQLAEAVGRMDAGGLLQLNEALSTDYLQGLDEVLQAAVQVKPESPDNYEFIPNVTSDESLGKWLVDRGRFKIAPQLLPHLNYASAGAEYRRVHDGAFLTGGYAGIQVDAVAQTKEERSVFQVTLRANRNTLQLFLPASGERMEQAKERLGVDDFCQAGILNVKAHDRLAHLMEMLPKDLVTVEELDALADCLQGMERTDGDIRKYCAVLEIEKPVTFSEAVAIAMDINDYERVPEDMEEYGKQNLRLAGAGDEILAMLEGHTDFEALGRDIAQEEGVRRTEFGLVRRLSSPFPAGEIGQTMC